MVLPSKMVMNILMSSKYLMSSYVIAWQARLQSNFIASVGTLHIHTQGQIGYDGFNSIVPVYEPTTLAHLSGKILLKSKVPSGPFSTAATSVTIVSMSSAGVTSNAGFHTPTR